MLQGVALVLGLLLVGGFGLIALDYRPYNVPTGSMSPAIAVGDTVLGRRIDGASVVRGDVVVFRDAAWGNEVMVKRVVGVGGDTVVCCDPQGRLTVNGTPVDERYLHQSAVTSGEPFSAKVPAGRLFLLGDNRVGSLDSRVHLTVLAGTVPTTDVLARVEATVWPWDRVGARTGTTAFAALGTAPSRPGPLIPAAYAMAAGTVVILLTSMTGPVAGLVRRLRGWSRG